MLVIRAAVLSDVTSISALLRSDGMRTEGVLERSTRYWVADDEVRLVGAIGLELGHGCVLLRSAIVVRSARGQGVGRRLAEHALEWARENGYLTAYCFSTDAGSYWTARGFSVCSVNEIVKAMPEAPQVRLFDRLGWLPTESAYRIGLSGILP